MCVSGARSPCGEGVPPRPGPGRAGRGKQRGLLFSSLRGACTISGINGDAQRGGGRRPRMPPKGHPARLVLLPPVPPCRFARESGIGDLEVPEMKSPLYRSVLRPPSRTAPRPAHCGRRPPPRRGFLGEDRAGGRSKDRAQAVPVHPTCFASSRRSSPSAPPPCGGSPLRWHTKTDLDNSLAARLLSSCFRVCVSSRCWYRSASRVPVECR